MAGRKDKNTVDYFPHYVNSGKTLFIIESKFGLEGYAAWFKILELLGKNENHFIDCSDEGEFDYLEAKINLKNNSLESLLNLLAKLGAIHKELWEHKIIWSSNFVKNIEDVYKRRSNSCMYFNDLCKHKLIKCKHKYNDYGIIVDTNTQSKVKEIKEDKKYIYNKFYDFELEQSNNDENYKQFIDALFWDNNLGVKLSSVLKMETQVNYTQFKKMFTLKENLGIKITDVLEQMENWKDLKKRKTVYNTFVTFAKNMKK